MTQIHTSTRYRPEIDGLRALAVLPVVLYHAALSFPGGYVGVDIFFVISGFLITTIVQKQLHQGTFSIRSFWERRIRRIFPALTVLVLFTIAGSYYFLYPEAFKDFGKEVVAQAILVSNFYFAQQDGYFAAPSEFFPLLHTWSLAVEEQFYFLFPFLLIFLYKRHGDNTRIILTYLTVIALLSFSWSIYGVAHSPSNTFFLLPARAWELLCGSILAIWKPRHSWPAILNEILSWFSIATILATLFLYTAETPFPGLAALPPCLAAGLIIFCNREQATSSAKLLSAKPVVYLGKISYSFYLWHWPIIVFANYSSTGELSLTTKIFLVLASFLLACASYHFIETPYRIREIRRKTIFRGFATVTSLFLISGVIIYIGRGWPDRFSPDVRQYAVAGGERSKLLKDDGLLDKQTLSTIPLDDSTSEIRPILLWGDSHAAYTAPALEAICKQLHCRIYASAKATVPPLLHGFSISKPIAVDRNNATLEFIKKHNIKKVILIGRWDFYTNTEGEAHKPQSFYDNRNKTLDTNQAFESCLKDTLDKLTALGVEIYILKQIPYQHQDPPRILANSLRFGIGPDSLGTPLTDHLALQQFPNTMFEKYIHPNITIIDPTPFFTRNSKTCYMAENGHSLYRDKDHISQYGARKLAPLFETIFSTEEQSSQLE